MEPRNNCANHCATGSHGGDDVANPVDEVQEGSFRLSGGLPLDGHVCLRLGSQVLRPEVLACKDETDSGRSECPPQCVVHLYLHRVWSPFCFAASFRVNTRRESNSSAGKPTPSSRVCQKSEGVLQPRRRCGETSR